MCMQSPTPIVKRTQMKRQEQSLSVMEGEDAGPESSNDETDEEAAGSSDEEEEVASLAPSSGCPHGRRRRAPKKKSRVDEVGCEWKKEDNTPIDIP